MSMPENPQQPPYTAGQPQYQVPPQGPAATNDTTWASASHWSALVVWFLTSGVFAFVAPLIIMTTQGAKSPVVRRNAVASLNFQLSVLIYALVTGVILVIGIVLSFILIGIPIAILAGVALLAIVVAEIVCPIIASIKAANGEEYRYPLTMNLVS